jgi:hypothetical protein
MSDITAYLTERCIRKPEQRLAMIKSIALLDLRFRQIMADRSKADEEKPPAPKAEEIGGQET